MKVYLASPFFTDEQIKNVVSATKILTEKGFKVYVPMYDIIPKNELDKELWDNLTFNKDINQINECDLVVVLYYGFYSDSGTCWEVGYSFGINKKTVIVHLHNEKSNCMVHCGAYTNVLGLNGLKNYDFDKMKKFSFENIKPIIN